MTKFEAVFSSGERFTRGSKHGYTHAVAAIEIATGKVAGFVKFTVNPMAGPDWCTVIANHPSGARYSIDGYRGESRENKIWRTEARKQFRVEVVHVKVI